MSSPRSGKHIACGLAILAALWTLTTACSRPAPVATTGAGSSSTAAPATVESATAETAPVELTPVDRAAFDAILARSVGKVILVDCWATWCGPCVEQLPHSIALAKSHRDAGFEVVTLNFDDADAMESVVALLKKSGAPDANLTNLQTKFGGSSESMDAFEIASGALPHYKLFDRQGQLRHTFELDPAKQPFTPADIDAKIAELLAEK